jgi:Fe-S oxidoreductase
MCKPAAEVANLTQLESHTTRSRIMMMWRIAAGHLEWGEREAELIYESTLDSISEAFDVFHYPVSQYMLDARAEIWESGLAPESVKEAVNKAISPAAQIPPVGSNNDAVLLVGEIYQLDRSEDYIETLGETLQTLDVSAGIWAASSGAAPYVLGAREHALAHARHIAAEIKNWKFKRVIADGPETAWALTKMYPALGVSLPEGVRVSLLSSEMRTHINGNQELQKLVFVHDSRPAYLISESKPAHHAILPGYLEDENAFGTGEIYEAPRNILTASGASQVIGTWMRALAKSCGADDGLWLTYPHLAAGLARQRLDYIAGLGAEIVLTDSPLCADFLRQNAGDTGPTPYWLPEIFITA